MAVSPAVAYGPGQRYESATKALRQQRPFGDRGGVPPSAVSGRLLFRASSPGPVREGPLSQVPRSHGYLASTRFGREAKPGDCVDMASVPAGLTAATLLPACAPLASRGCGLPLFLVRQRRTSAHQSLHRLRWNPLGGTTPRSRQSVRGLADSVPVTMSTRGPVSPGNMGNPSHTSSISPSGPYCSVR